MENMVHTVKKRTMMTDEEIRTRYKQFVVDCPRGKLTKKRFIELLSKSMGPDAKEVAEAIFKV